MSRKKKHQEVTSAAPPEAPAQFWKAEAEAFRNLAVGMLEIKWAILGILLLGGLLRFWDLSDSSLWMDEITIIEEAHAREYRVVSYRAHAAHLYPVSVILGILGQTPFALRLWGALLGTLACAVMAKAGYIIGGRRVAMAAGLLTALNCFLVMYSQDGNYYGGMTFYVSIQLLCYLLFFRGLPHASALVFLIVSVIAYKNHPIAALPAAVMAGGMIVGVVLFSNVRRSLIAWKPREWFGRPVVPLMVVALLAGFPLYSRLFPRIAGFLSSVIEPGAGSLTNVELSADLLWRHTVVYLLNFYRNAPIDGWLVMVPMAGLLAGFGVTLIKGIRRWDPALLAMAGLLVVVPVASYFVLFSLNLNRNFNIRYFIYLTPILILPMAMLAGDDPEKDQESAAWNPPGIFPWAVAPILMLWFVYTGRYLLADLGNYRTGSAHLAKVHAPGDSILLTTRNDRVEGQFYFRNAALPRVPPEANYLYQPGYPNMMSAAFPAMMSGSQNRWIVSAWRYVEMPALYAMLEAGLAHEFSGISKWGPLHDFKLYRWDVGDRVLYPNAAARFPLSIEGSSHVLVAGAGKWKNPGSDFVYETTGATRLELPASGSPATFVPVLDDSVVYTFDSIISPPVHSRYFLKEHDGRPYLRIERDGTLDFLVYQDARPREFVVRLLRRDESDPLLNRNSSPIPPGMLLGVSVDGIHRGFWPVEPGPRDVVEIPLSLNLEPGNHRVSIWGLQPRLSYLPYFPWDFVEAEWRVGEGNASPSVEESGAITLSPGWTALPLAGEPGGRLGRDWIHAGAGNPRIDNTVRAPGGDPAITMNFPGGEGAQVALLSPPMPVEPGMLAAAFYYLKYDGLEQVELSPIVAFYDTEGRQLSGQLPINGPNHRGTTLESWVRVSAAVPVPPRAGFMRIGFMGYPYKGESTGATVYVGTFLSPGVEGVRIADPSLPESYFGILE